MRAVAVAALLLLSASLLCAAALEAGQDAAANVPADVAKPAPAAADNAGQYGDPVFLGTGALGLHVGVCVVWATSSCLCLPFLSSTHVVLESHMLHSGFRMHTAAAKRQPLSCFVKHHAECLLSAATLTATLPISVVVLQSNCQALCVPHAAGPAVLSKAAVRA